MALASGSRLGPYEIAAPIGAGGMGEVYRARDHKLGREVALKVLPNALAADAQYMARFQREARVLASLNHPHIASIYGLEESDSVRALVMELVEGPTLAKRIKTGPISVKEALEIARQIAEALEYAHEKGIIHRDLKPANVIITPEGAVKVLDFGLAQATEKTVESGQLEDAPTASPTLTQAGTILGTAAYMAPEQTRGEAVDKRADVWSFGAVLLEMLTGKQTFRGETVSETLAAVLTQDPDWAALPGATPPTIRRLLKRCLDRDRKTRLRDIGEARIAIEAYLADPAAVSKTAENGAVAEVRGRHHILHWAVTAFFAMLAAAIGLVHFREAPRPERLLNKYLLPPPEKTAFIHLALSPDGRLLAFIAFDSGNYGLWIRRFDGLTARPLGNNGGVLPFWSPDNRSVGFFGDGLMKVDIGANGEPGPPQKLCDVFGVGGATWSRNGVIVFGVKRGSPLYRVAATGGETKAVTRLDASRKEIWHVWPWFLPDGRHFLYTVVSDQPENSGIYVGTLDSLDRKHLLRDLSNAIYVGEQGGTGYLLFVRHGNLLAQGFNAGKLELSSEPRPIAQGVTYDPSWAGAGGFFSASENGVLVFVSGPTHTRLAWFDRNGRPLETIEEGGLYNSPRLSPDEKRLALVRLDMNTGTSDIWLRELPTGIMSRFTSDPRDEHSPVWSSDGQHIAFSSNRENASDLYKKDASGSGAEEVLIKSSLKTHASDWSPDGRFLLYDQEPDSTQTGAAVSLGRSDLWVLPLAGDRKQAPLQKTDFWEGWGTFSPDGKWVAYMSNESGDWEIYVRAFQPTDDQRQASSGYGIGRKYQISKGGVWPRWRGDGKELYYQDIRREYGGIMAVALRTSPTFESGIPRLLFRPKTALVGQPGIGGERDDVYRFNVTANGQRFLLPVETEADTGPATVVLNWTQGLRP